MKPTYEERINLPPENTQLSWLNRVEAVRSAASALGKGTLQSIIATDAGRYVDYSVSSAIQPSDYGNSTRLPHSGPPSTLSRRETTCCPTHDWKPTHHPPCQG